ncbi:ExbD/TolR family protein [Marinobacter xestospongiae]|uniref:ExbD/TolR family protein n=1 Tax=Marinobacter xestospongiae TaxID=994319 RepID=UPI002004B254|nr:biopolymer transporter ExbD [Marinobacter xestospongiae]MCK7567085.1 biopolymer transporter ExbD [Marinobacter xestospongiae]
MQLVDPRPSRPIPIRITPLIDVVFILLVFFMLTSRLLPTSFLELDNSTAPGQSVDGDPLPELVVEASGQIRWQDQEWALPALLQELRRTQVTEVNLATTGEAQLTDFTRTLTTLKTAGIEPHWQRSAPAQESE